MKKILRSTLFACSLFSVSHAENPTLLVPQSPLIDASAFLEEDEVKIIDQLIVSTESQLRMEKRLKESMVNYKKYRDEFELGNQTKSHAALLVRTARQISEMITDNHLEHLFAKDYLDELTFFSSIAGKTAVVRP